VKRFVSGLVVTAVLLATAPILPVVHGAERLDLRVSPMVSLAPASVVVRAIVEQDPHNRGLEIVADSSDFYRRTVVDLDGEQAPRTTELKLVDIPGGRYEVSATLYMQDGTSMTVRREVMVMSTPQLVR